MDWTTTPPTAPGWYWHDSGWPPASRGVGPEIVRVVTKHGLYGPDGKPTETLAIWRCEGGGQDSIGGVYHEPVVHDYRYAHKPPREPRWAGPIPEPKEPR